jgi:hypothetical protein
MVSAAPHCPSCGHDLDRIDHHAIEHMILRDEVYCPTGIDEGDGHGGYGVASEVSLRCAYCGAEVPQQSRRYFYERWYQVLAFSQNLPPATLAATPMPQPPGGAQTTAGTEPAGRKAP